MTITATTTTTTTATSTTAYTTTTTTTTKTTTKPTTTTTTTKTTTKPTTTTTTTTTTTKTTTKPTTTTTTTTTTSTTAYTTTTTTTTKTTTKPTTTSTTASDSELSIDLSELSLCVGEQYTISANQSNLTYKSSNTDVVIVSQKGVVTALSCGNAIIIVYNENGDAVTLEISVSDYLKGDVNGDNELNLVDAVILQKCLLGFGKITNWQSADLCKDGIINVFDMIEMKRLIIQSRS